MRTLTVAALATLALGIAACGDDEDSSGGGGGGDALTKAEYQAQVKKICQDGDKAEEGLGQPKSASKEDLVAFFNKGLDMQKTYDEKLSAINPPEEFADAHEEVVKLRRESQEIIQSVIDQVEKGEPPQEVVQKLDSDAQRISKRSNELADTVGVPECKS